MDLPLVRVLAAGSYNRFFKHQEFGVLDQPEYYFPCFNGAFKWHSEAGRKEKLMEAGKPVEVMRLDDWLPPYGETKVDLKRLARNLHVSVEYDGVSGPVEKVISFMGVTSFSEQLFPGPSQLAVTYSHRSSDSLNSLFEYPDSQLANEWSDNFYWKRKIRHFSLIFPAENLRLSVFAESFSVDWNYDVDAKQLEA